MFWTAVRSCVGVSLVRKKAKSLLWALECALNICIVCIRLIMHARVVPRGTGPVWKISNSWHKAKTGRTDYRLWLLLLYNINVTSSGSWLVYLPWPFWLHNPVIGQNNTGRKHRTPSNQFDGFLFSMFRHVGACSYMLIHTLRSYFSLFTHKILWSVRIIRAVKHRRLFNQFDDVLH